MQSLRRLRIEMALLAALLPALCVADDGVVLRDDVPLDIYLHALEKVSPAALAGAQAYMAAFEQRCGRALGTLELRRAVAEGAGDPVLMQMIRAAYEHDAAATQRLSAGIRCPASSLAGRQPVSGNR